MLSTLILFGVVALTAGLVYGAIYRLYLTPIAHIPGPPLAKLTYWYEFYYDVVKQGQYTWKIEELHAQYGPIIRVNPHEVHVADSSFADTIYLASQASRTIDKFPFASRAFGNPDSFFGTNPHEQHRSRRAPLNRFFTRAAIVKFEDVIHYHLDRVVDLIRTAKRDGEIVNLTNLFGGFTADVIGEYAVGEPLGILDDKEMGRGWRLMWLNIVAMAALCKQFPSVSWAMRALPPSVTERMDANFTILNNWFAALRRRIQNRKAEYAKPGSQNKVHYTMLDELLFGELPDEDKTERRIQDEAQALLGAGSLTTAEILSALSFHVLDDRTILSRLQADLLPVVSEAKNKNTTARSSGRPKWTDLEHLPYLNAVIKEALRFYYGLIQRSPRIHRDADLMYNGTIIPRGTPVGVSAYVVHNDKSIYGEDVDKFNPDRWLVDDKALLARREKNLSSFGRGSRMCLGIQLAMAELILTCATLFSPKSCSGFELQLKDTDYEAVRTRHDFLVAYPSLNSKGVRVTVS